MKAPLLAPLELTIEADERMDAEGNVVKPLDVKALRRDLKTLADKGEVEALTICLLNSYVDGTHEAQVRDVAQEFFGDIPISISSDVVPEMQEYERTETTVVNSYVRPQVSKYVANMQTSLEERLHKDVNLAILRSDGGLASARASGESPVNMLLSGPAGGVAPSALVYSRPRPGREQSANDAPGQADVREDLHRPGQSFPKRNETAGDILREATTSRVRR